MMFLSKKAQKYAALALAALMTFSVLPSGTSRVKAESLPNNTGDFNAAYSTTAVNIDGVPDEAGWQVTQDLTLGASASNNNSAKFGAMWDENYLYVAFDVTDANKATTGGELWEVDSVEIYIDGDLSRTYNNHSIQYIFKRDDPTVYPFNYAMDPTKVQEYAKGVVQKSVDTANGYTVEAAIPWSSIGGMKAPAGKQIGITAHVNDRDVDSAGNVHMDYLTYTADNGDWCDASSWAKMKLVENGDPSQVATPVTYEFTRLGGLDGVTNPQAGWTLGSHSESSSFDFQSYYGFHTENYDLNNRYADFNFIVPSEADYSIKIKGFLAGGGAICDIRIDGQNVGQYDFFGGGVFGDLKFLSNMHLSAGAHVLSIVPVGRSNGSWGYNIYANQFVIDLPVTNKVTYDFTRLAGLEGVTNPQAGWSLIADTSTDGHYLESYGYHTENYDDPGTVDDGYLDANGNPVERYSSFSFEAPADGDYFFNFKGFLAGGGAICDISVDGTVIGQYDFFGAGAYGDFVALNGMHLSKGTHMLKIKPVSRSDGSWGFNIYASKFVVEQQPKLVSLKLELDNGFLVEGQSELAKLYGLMTDGTVNSLGNAEKNITSSNPAVATVDSRTGAITAVSAGTTMINAQITLNGVTVNRGIKLTVISPDAVDLRLTADKTHLIITQSTQLRLAGSYGIFPVSIPESNINVTISDKSVISIDSNNVITALSTGVATILADVTFGSTVRHLSLDVSADELKLDSITLKALRPSIYVGQTSGLVVEGLMNSGDKADLSGAAISYSSRNPEIATVDSASGRVTPVSPGTAIIEVTVTLNNVTLISNTQITVKDPATLKGVKMKTSLYTDEKIANARNNIAKYEWAKAEKDNVTAKADEYLALGEDFWWNIVTSQNVPRSFSVNQKMVCPICGTDIYKEYGNYPWVMDPVNHPWKLICPKCKSLFPANDFGAYYKSGLDAYGKFDPKLADKSLLKNTLYPDKPENWCVDDGFGGYGNDASQKLLFIAYYNHWGLWYDAHSYGIIQDALDAFRDAYLYTGEEKYAHIGTILLDRIADVYPEMDSSVYKWDDGFLNSHGGTGLGKILGSIWETIIVPSFIRAYDAFYPAMDSEDTVNYLKNKADIYNMSNPKISGNAIRKNIEDGILRQVLPGVKNCQLEGNTGMQQSCIALAAVVLDSLPETKELIEFNNNPLILSSSPRTVTGGGLLPILVDEVDRDGQGNECAPGYNYLWLQQLRQVADVMDGYTLPGLDASADLYKNPKFIKMFKAFYPLILSSRYSAAIGDTGGTGTAGLMGDLADCIKGFEKTGDTTLAQLAYYMNHSRVDGLHSDIFSADPYKIVSDIQAIIDKQGELKLNSTNMTGFGFAALRDGTNYVKDAGIIYNFKDLPITRKDAEFGYYSNSGTMQFDAMNPGLTAEFSFNVAAEDDYEIDLKTFKAASYGIYDIFIDGIKIATYDFYGTSGAGNLEKIGAMHLTAGTHKITFVNNGRNAGNTEAYKMGVIQLSLLNAKAQEIKRISDEKGDTQRDVWMYYGHNGNHGHADSLNLGMHAFGIDIAPELGYPEYTGPDPKRLQWESNTISHNTVVVDNSKQQEQFGGTPLHFDDSDMVKLMDADARGAYSQTSTYRRTTALIKVDENNSYAIDLFRIVGGSNHNFSFHSNEGTVTTEGLNLTAQGKGTYAGPDIDYAKRYDSVDGWGYNGSGYHYLINVEKDTAPASQFSVDWKIDPSRSPLPFEQDVHLKLTMLTQANDVALADGLPPQRPANPDKLKYFVVHRNGENLSSLFTSVLQPYKNSPFIQSIEKVELRHGNTVVADDSATAIKVVLKNGRTDYIVNSLDSTITYKVDGKFNFKGFFGVYSEINGKQVYGYINDGKLIGSVEGKDCLKGTISDFTRDLSSTNEIIVKMGDEVSAETLKGRYIYVENDGVRNASYEIKNVSKLADGMYKLDIGDVTLIRKFADQKDFSKGYIYDIANGQTFRIPLSVSKKVNP